ncbi:hypothetical protein [Halolamina sediminis]|uniref:hypothetical protein n=1 Tax=Halolamina sediminis TaxID=1480675 RepID=UPI0006B65BA2|nr:hypothetical protein [Halolamina sediminis]
MVESEKQPPADPLPSQLRRTVSSNEQFQLPVEFVAEVGFQSPRVDTTQGAKTAWYYHERHDKAVLASDAVDRPSLEFIGTSSLTGVSNDDIVTGDVDAARVKIITALPSPLYERLIAGSVVLKPVYEGRDPELNATCVSVYPAEAYDDGSLPNVDREQDIVETDDSRTEVQVTHDHQNSV